MPVFNLKLRSRLAVQCGTVTVLCFVSGVEVFILFDAHDNNNNIKLLFNHYCWNVIIMASKIRVSINLIASLQLFLKTETSFLWKLAHRPREESLYV